MAAPSAPSGRAGRREGPDCPSDLVEVNVPVDRAIPYGGLVPASSKAAAAGRTSPVKGCLAPDGQSGCIEKPSGAVVKSGCIDCIEKSSGEKPSGAVVKAGCIDCIEKPSGADVTRDGVLIPVGNGLWQLPDEEVQWVLSRRREDIPSDLFGPDCVEWVNAVRDEFFEYQAWLRAEYDANDGCVFVDDKFVAEIVAEREEHEQWMSSWSVPMTHRLDLVDSDFSDRLSDFYEEDSEDEVEVQELDTN